MNVFLAHVGIPGNVDIAYTVRKSRSITEFESLPTEAQERPFLLSRELKTAFPTGCLNCWGVPQGAVSVFQGMRVGDLVLLAPQAGKHGAIEQLGVVRAICPVSA